MIQRISPSVAVKLRTPASLSRSFLTTSTSSPAFFTSKMFCPVEMVTCSPSFFSTTYPAWGERITAYLVQDARLKLVVGLVDPRVPTSDLDVDLAHFVRQADKVFLAVLTKADKLGRGALAQASQRIMRDLELETVPLAVSSLTGSGCRELLTAIQRTLENTDVPAQGA